MNKIGKFIPYIFMEWGHLPNNPDNCKHFTEWVESFYEGGYVPLDSGERGGGGISIENLLIIPAKMLRVNTTERDTKWDLVWAHSSVL